MIFEKRGMWKSSHGAAKFSSREKAEKWERENGHTVDPLEMLKKKCNECGCDPCECEEEWNSVEETSSMTESLMEDHS